jgi:ABC-type antimicrobial peptide transport system permease subunit
VVTLMLAQGGRLVGVGLAVGIVLSLLAGKLLRTQLYAIEPSDPLSFAGVSIVLAVAATAACYIPARRAGTVDPMTALRRE